MLTCFLTHPQKKTALAAAGPIRPLVAMAVAVVVLVVVVMVMVVNGGEGVMLVGLG